MTTASRPANAGWSMELDFAIETARAAAAEIARFYESGSAAIRAKGDDSPVTDADLASDRIIRERIGRAFPADALLTEEGADDPSRLSVRRCWIADPLDGTQDFINRTGQFDVFLALAEDGAPVVGVACHPPTGLVLAAAAGGGAWLDDGAGRQPLRTQPAIGETPRLNTNRYHTRPDDWPLLRRIALRANLVPPSEPHPFHPRAFFPVNGNPPAYEAHLGIGPARPDESIGGEWDLAAPDIILAEAGGLLTDLQGQRLRYNQPDPAIRRGLIATASPELTECPVVAYALEAAPANVAIDPD